MKTAALSRLLLSIQEKGKITFYSFEESSEFRIIIIHFKRVVRKVF